jgi:hypothetical protein
MVRTYIEQYVPGQTLASLRSMKDWSNSYSPAPVHLGQNNAPAKALSNKGFTAQSLGSELDLRGKIWYRTNIERAGREQGLKTGAEAVCGLL